MNITIICEGFDQSSLLLQPWRRIYELSRRVTKRSISVTIVSDRSSDQPEMDEIAGIRINRISHFSLAPFIKKEELLEAITGNKPDVVIWYGSLLSPIYLTQLRSIERPLIWDVDAGMRSLTLFRRISFREAFHPHHRTYLLYQALTTLVPRFVIRSVANSALISKIIVPGEYLRDYLCRIGVESHKIAVIPSTVEMNETENPDTSHTTEEYERGSCETERFRVTYIGSPCTLRGTDTAIRSIKKIVGKCKNVKLVIFSRRDTQKTKTARDYEASEEDYLKKLTEKSGIEDHVEIVSGTLSWPDLKEHIITSDVITLPFKIIPSEPPLSVLEAMGLGKVVITTDQGILPAIIGKNRGILIKPGDSDALAQAILFLSVHPEESLQIGSNAKRFVNGLPDWDDLALKFTSLLKEAVKEA